MSKGKLFLIYFGHTLFTLTGAIVLFLIEDIIFNWYTPKISLGIWMFSVPLMIAFIVSHIRMKRKYPEMSRKTFFAVDLFVLLTITAVLYAFIYYIGTHF